MASSGTGTYIIIISLKGTIAVCLRDLIGDATVLIESLGVPLTEPLETSPRGDVAVPLEEPLRVSLTGARSGSLTGEVAVPQGGANPALLGEGLAVPQRGALLIVLIVALERDGDIIPPPRVGSVSMGGTNTVPLFRDAAAPQKGAISVPSGGHGPVLQNGAMVLLSLRDPLPDPLAGQGVALLEGATAVPLSPGYTGLLPDSITVILRELTTGPLRADVVILRGADA